jgi:hypothetical protein
VAAGGDDSLRLTIGARSNSLRVDENLELPAISCTPDGFVAVRE